MIRPPPRSPLFPYTPLFRSAGARHTPVVSAPITTVVSIRALRMGTSRNGVGAERSVARSLCRGVAACQVCRVGATAALAAPTVAVIADDDLTAATHSHPAVPLRSTGT